MPRNIRALNLEIQVAEEYFFNNSTPCNRHVEKCVGLIVCYIEIPRGK